MRRETTPLPGVELWRAAPSVDARGAFERLWEATPRAAPPAQVSIARTAEAGTLRGLHFALPPHEEAKVVRCLRGAVFDVVVDLRAGSPARGRAFATTLRPEGPTLIVPPGCAHGYQALEPDSDVLYLIDRPYAPEAARALRHDDPALGLAWPLPARRLAARDRAAMGLEEALALRHRRAEAERQTNRSP